MTIKSTPNTARNKKKRSTQARGRARRELLIQTTKDLLDEQALESISLADIAQRAGIPTASAYHFFPNVNAAFAAVAQRFAEELDAVISAPYEVAAGTNWPDIIYQAIERATEIYTKSAGYQQLIVGGKAPPDIKLSDRGNDEVLGRLLMGAISQHFVLPDMPRATDIFFFAVEIIDLFYMLSVMREGRVSKEMLTEAKRAAHAYLRVYLPRELPRRVAATL